MRAKTDLDEPLADVLDEVEQLFKEAETTK